MFQWINKIENLKYSYNNIIYLTIQYIKKLVLQKLQCLQ